MSNSTLSKVKIDDPAWYKQWFDSPYYHQLYNGRDEKEATDFIRSLLKKLNPNQNSRMIDVGCGAGRHCIQLARQGHDVTGLDLSGQSISKAKNHESCRLRFFQQDMRLEFGYHYYDYVFNFFTSFGYFRNPEEHEQVMSNLSNALKPGGILVMDYLNVNKAAACLVPWEKKEIQGVEFHIERWLTKTAFFKQIRIVDQQNHEGLDYVEQVARFTLADFNRLMAGAGLQIREVYGDYALNKFDYLQSPRLIMIAEKLK